MKPTTDAAHLVVFGAHPDDIEFGCGGVVAREVHAGRKVHLVVCSRGEAATNGTPRQRTAEAKAAAAALGATLEFIDLGGDAHFQVSVANALTIAAIIRRRTPELILAPTPVENQHPDHAVLGKLVRDAARLARYGGVKELRRQKAHAIAALYFYAITIEGEPVGEKPVFVDVSETPVRDAWVKAMEAHVSQAQTRRYVELQIARATLNGARCGVEWAMPVFPSDPLVVESFAPLPRGARHY